MGTLLDIAATHASVEVAGGAVDIRGISAEGLATLMTRFPAISDLMSGKELNLEADALMSMGPPTVAAIIAAGCGFPGDAAAESKAANLPLGDQVEMLAAIMKATLPAGIKKVIDRLGEIAAAAGLSQTPSPRP